MPSKPTPAPVPREVLQNAFYNVANYLDVIRREWIAADQKRLSLLASGMGSETSGYAEIMRHVVLEGVAQAWAKLRKDADHIPFALPYCDSSLRDSVQRMMRLTELDAVLPDRYGETAERWRQSWNALDLDGELDELLPKLYAKGDAFMLPPLPPIDSETHAPVSIAKGGPVKNLRMQLERVVTLSRERIVCAVWNSETTKLLRSHSPEFVKDYIEPTRPDPLDEWLDAIVGAKAALHAAIPYIDNKGVAPATDGEIIDAPGMIQIGNRFRIGPQQPSVLIGDYLDMLIHRTGMLSNEHGVSELANMVHALMQTESTADRLAAIDAKVRAASQPTAPITESRETIAKIGSRTKNVESIEKAPPNGEEESIGPALTANESRVLQTMARFDASLLLSSKMIADETADPESKPATPALSEEKVRQCVVKLIKSGWAERPDGSRSGARLKTAGRIHARKIAD